ncbi:MAG TPA: hypothetical protein DCR21_04145 [Succinivibrionaceae bacterium]|nr:hypothetical protein [Succinivibrionaceae bacterium]
MINSYNLPYSDTLPVNKLSAVFSSTTASYKFYWFLGILDLIEEHNLAQNNTVSEPNRISLRMIDIACRMVINSWYPLYCRVNFGPSDKLSTIREALIKAFKLSEDADRKELENAFRTDTIGTIEKSLRPLLTYVPYRFLSPWTGSSDSNQYIAERSLQKDCQCMYAVLNEEKEIVIAPDWLNYLSVNLMVLRDFIYWNLFLYLQRRNPHDQFIAGKILRAEQRESLSTRRELWNTAIEQGVDIICPYTEKKVVTTLYDLDHFIPWRYVCNNLMWNLTPADPSINRSKGDSLPDMDAYLYHFACNQREMIRVLAEDKTAVRNSAAIKDDYLSLGVTLEELASMDDSSIISFYDKLIRPYFLQASNIGFPVWKFNK